MPDGDLGKNSSGALGGSGRYTALNLRRQGQNSQGRPSV